ncbi:MAG TPA: hypothetical protein VIJ13_02705, partial [Actinomycetota bacterium]
PLGADGVWTKRGPPTAASNARLIAEPGCRLPLVSSGSGDTGVCLSGDHDTVRGPTRRDDLGFLRRLLGGGQQQPYRRSGWSPEQRPGWMRQGMEVQLYDGRENLKVVGEASYQDNLWRVVGGHGSSNDRVRLEVYAVLVAETDNPYDANAISVWIQGLRVGYLSREDARRYRPGLLALERKHGKPIALAGAIVGGGMRADGPGRLGVFLDHDPADFGLRPRHHPEYRDPRCGPASPTHLPPTRRRNAASPSMGPIVLGPTLLRTCRSGRRPTEPSCIHSLGHPVREP